MKTLPIKRNSEGRAYLNLACGTRTDWSWNNLDFSPYATLRHYPRLARLMEALGFLSAERKQRLSETDPEIIRWNLARGVPFPADTFDVVYHSHFFEHLPRPAAKTFLAECRRVLKPGGVLRMVLPDLEAIVLMYIHAVGELDRGSSRTAALNHEQAIFELFDQMVRSESSGTKQQQNAVKRAIEKLLRGGADKTGENHRWMYDRHSLRLLLDDVGFEDIRQHSPETSSIREWDEFAYLDRNPDGTPYKQHSLYLEARKEMSSQKRIETSKEKAVAA
jgi:SAM-dependent methyltransferase